MDMQTGMYAIRDQATGLFLPPFPSPNNNTAIRQFSNAVAQEGHEFQLHPEDFDLHLVGGFDNETAQLTATSPPLLIITARNCVSQLGRDIEARDASFPIPERING